MADTKYRDSKGKFLKGNPGSPGRPIFSLLSIIKGQLDKVPENEKRSYAELLVERYIQNALKENDGVAIRDLVDRFDGRPRQSVDVNTVFSTDWIEFWEGIDAGEISGEPETANNPK